MAMRKGERSKAKMIAATAELLQRQGYHGTGLKQILALSGAPKGSLYFYFPGGKEQLACEALHSSGAAWEQRLRLVIDAAPDLGSAVRGACRALADELFASGFIDGCPIATVALEAASTSPAVRETCAAQYGAWRVMIADLLREGGTDPNTADELALFVLSAIEGALLLARVAQDTSALEVAGRMLETLIRAHAVAAD